jgi:excisionase family DNA binding protein
LASKKPNLSFVTENLVACAVAAMRTGCHLSTIHKMINDGRLHHTSEGGQRRVSVEALQALLEKSGARKPGPDKVRASAAVPQPAADDLHVTVEGDEDGDPLHYYDKDRDTYTFTKMHNATLPGSIVREIVESYSWLHGKGDTINDIARKHGQTRARIKGILKALGKTHDSLGETDEVIATMSEEELVEDQVRAKEQRVIVAAEKKRWAEVKKIAEEAERWDQFVFKRMEALAPKIRHQPVPPQMLKGSVGGKYDGRTALFMGLQDFHWGKYSWGEEVGADGEYNKKRARERLFDATQQALTRALMLGRPAKVIVPCGGDFFHVDNPQHMTTKGTPQTMDGTFVEMLATGFDLFGEWVDLVSGVAPVEVVQMAGNHDKGLSFCLLKWAEANYKNNDQITIRTEYTPRVYRMHGSTLIGFTHGDGPKPEKLAQLMASEARQHWSSADHKLWFGGHWHHLKTSEHYGVQCFTMSSLSGTDGWHAENGYVGTKKALGAYIVDPEEGLIAHMPVMPGG